MQNGRRGRGGAGHRSVGPVRSRVQNACFEGSLLLWEAERVGSRRSREGWSSVGRWQVGPGLGFSVLTVVQDGEIDPV